DETPNGQHTSPQNPQTDSPEVHELEMSVDPRPEKLQELGITPPEFRRAYAIASERLFKLFELNPNEVPNFEDLELEVHGMRFRLADLAIITITGVPVEWLEDNAGEQNTS